MLASLGIYGFKAIVRSLYPRGRRRVLFWHENGVIWTGLRPLGRFADCDFYGGKHQSLEAAKDDQFGLVGFAFHPVHFLRARGPDEPGEAPARV